MEKLSSMKLVPGAKDGEDHTDHKNILLSLWILWVRNQTEQHGAGFSLPPYV